MRHSRSTMAKAEAEISRLASAVEMYDRYGRAGHAAQCRRRIAELEATLLQLRAVDHELRSRAARRVQ